jgi:hypothetical protein
LGADFFKEADFDFELALFGVEDEGFVLFEVGGNKALGIDQGLLANVIGGGVE